MDFEVAPGPVRNGGGELICVAEELRRDVPADRGPGADRGWAATLAGDEMAAAADAAVRALCGHVGDLGRALRRAADAYETADERAHRRLRW